MVEMSGVFFNMYCYFKANCHSLYKFVLYTGIKCTMLFTHDHLTALSAYFYTVNSG